MSGNGLAQQEPGAAAADDDLPRTLVIELDPPITWSNDKTYTELRLEEPTGQQVIKAEQELMPPINYVKLRMYQFVLISLVADVPRGVVEKMRITQITKATDFLSAYMPGGLSTGAI